MAARVNYDEIAGTFDARYTAGLCDGVLAALVDLITEKRPTCELEVGCGTGYWLSACASLLRTFLASTVPWKCCAMQSQNVPAQGCCAPRRGLCPCATRHSTWSSA